MVGSEQRLSEITREVQLADQLLTETFPMAQDPKILLQVVRHAAHALEQMAQATSLDNTMKQLRTTFRTVLADFDASPQVFSRKEKFVIASDDFSHLDILTEQHLIQSLQSMKEFIYRVMTCKA